MPRCAVVYNPTKVSDGFCDNLSPRLEADGWAETLWLQTSAEDPGHAMTAQAVSERVDLVIAAGGDGTIRIVAQELARSGITMGLIPAGTGNLLARNLGIPLAEAAAIEVALGPVTRTIDLVSLTVDGQEGEQFAVMAGMGVDAMIMDETNPDLKAKIGSAAYFVAAGKALGRLPMDVSIRVDGGRPHRRRAMLALIGNVGDLTGNITLIPEAKPDDGVINVFVASPHNLVHWVRVFVRLLTRRGHRRDSVDHWHGRRVELRLRHRENYQLDGDVVGECLALVAEVVPEALQVKVPVSDAG